MKYFYKMFGLACLLSLKANASGQELTCSEVSIVNSDAKYYYQLFPSESSLAVNGASPSLYFEPGVHSLSILKWRLRDWVNYSKLKEKFEKKRSSKKVGLNLPSSNSPKAVSISIDVDEKRQYIVEELAGDFNVKLVDNSSFNCDVEKHKVISSVVSTNIEKLLSPELLYRLDKTMAQIKNSNVAIGENFIPFSLVVYFGAVSDSGGKKNRLLAVTPNSNAERLGLQAGDEIIQLGGKELEENKSLDNSIFDYLQSTNYSDSLEIEILRNNEKLMLSGLYMPEVIPEYIYEFANEVQSNKKHVTYSSPIEDNFKKRLNSLIIEIGLVLHSKEIEFPKGRIIRARSLDRKFGITINPNSLKQGFLVESVRSESSAEQLGLMKGDIITHFNSVELEKDIRRFSTMVGSLIQNQNYSVSVERAGVNRLLQSQFTPSIFPSYELLIDFSSKKRAHELLANKKRYNKWINKNNGWDRRVEGWQSRNAFSFMPMPGHTPPRTDSSNSSSKN